MNKESFDSKIKYLKENDNISDYLVEYLSQNMESLHSKLFIWYARALNNLIKNNKENSQSIPHFIIIDAKKEISDFESDINNLEISLSEYLKSDKVDENKKLEIENRLNKNKEQLNKLKSYFNTKELLKENHKSIDECYRHAEDQYLSERRNGYDLSGYSLAIAWMNSEYWHNVDLVKINTEKEKKEYKDKGNIIFKYDDYYVAELRLKTDFDRESDNLKNCIRGYYEKVSPTHRFFSLRTIKDNQPHIDAEFQNGKFTQIKGYNNREIKLEYQFVFLQFLYNLCNYDQERIDEAIGESSDYANFGEQETLPNGEIQFFYTYKGEKYILEKFEKIEDPE